MNDQLLASIHELTTVIELLNETLDEKLNTITYSIDGVSQTLDPLAEALKQIRDEISLAHGKNLY